MSGDKLNVFEIERFAIHDGPGIRTTVFLQGCGLRCAWCANPESHKVGQHVMFFSQKCVGCGRCKSACTQNAVCIRDGKALIDRERCISCGNCARVCLSDALKISGRKMTCKELYEIVARDLDYYEQSGGGVTLSGGEALLQFNELIPFLQKCQENGIHIAVETCGYVTKSTIQSALSYVDVFLFDIKTLNGPQFRQYTGGDLNTVLSSFEYLCQYAAEKVTVRIPVIPEFNDHNIYEIMKYAADKGIRQLHLLPYHTLGISKYEQLGRTYPFPVRKALEPDTLQPFIQKGAELGLAVKVGG